jgi:hypothetical protein
MKTIVLRSVILIAFLYDSANAQVINWANVSEQKGHLLHVHAGADYGVTAGAGYLHQLRGRKFPLWLGAEFSVPAGNGSVADDFKLKLGGQIRIIVIDHFHVSAHVQGIARRYQDKSVRLFNFGSDMAAIFGYYAKKWFWAVETGFDKAIVTHFKHSDWFKKNIYSNVQDGWYEPSTGGNFYYGFRGGYSMRKTDLTFKAGKLVQQDFKSIPLLPFYGQLGMNFTF